MTSGVRHRGNGSRRRNSSNEKRLLDTVILEGEEYPQMVDEIMTSPPSSVLVSDDSDYGTRGESDASQTTIEDYDSGKEVSLWGANRIAGKRGGSTIRGDIRLGVTLDGLRVFKVPDTPSQIEGLFQMWYAPRSFITWLGIIFTMSVFFSFPDRPYLIVSVSVFWRLCCNLGLGYILHAQSKSFYMTLWIHEIRSRPFSSTNSMVSTLLSSTMFGAQDILRDATLPDCFPSWILFRNIVDIVEVNELVAFALTASRYGLTSRMSGNLVLNSTLMSMLADFSGLLLIGLSIYSKVAARRAVGDYAWYWGDFFFLRTGSSHLSFDGVFELFPHPMYTVGYGWTYGCAILARSSTVLALCMSYHLLQLLFLTFVENPHVDKIYGRKAGGSDKTFTSEDGSVTGSLMKGSSNLLVVKNFDLFRASDVNLALMLFFFMFGCWVGSRPGGPLDQDAYFILQAVFMHIFSSGIKAAILLHQEKTKFWTKHFLESGRNELSAFESWKRLYNMLQSLQYISFIMCSMRLGLVPQVEDWTHPLFVSQLVLGLMLVIISMWSFSSCYEVLGDYGWFYGDFFITFKMSGEARAPSYQGIYRYLNNPDAYLGHLWMYGFALISMSPELAVVALLSHAMKIAFLQTVEKPHFRQVYKQNVRKSSTALGKAIRKKVGHIRSNETAMFLANWIKHPIETGALAPSSEQLANAMTDTMFLGDNSVVVELGPGTGPFTRRILEIQSQYKNTTYIAFELNQEFQERLCNLFPQQKDSFLLESAENIVKTLKSKGLDHADTIISGLPWAIFPTKLQIAILNEVYAALPVGGRFCTFAYLQGLVMPAGQSFKMLLDKTFKGNVERSDIVWKNLPPAFVYRCEKKSS